MQFPTMSFRFSISPYGWMVFLIVFSVFTSHSQELDSYIQSQLPELNELYKHLHQNPELSLQEKETSERMALELMNAGYKVTKNIGGYGVVGVLENGPGPVLLIRADMDALPMEEKTGLPYASKKKGVTSDGNETYIAHSCGHDIHMTVFVGAAKSLMELKDQWSGTLLMVAQPSEENGLGAYAMMQDGLYSRFPHPDYAISLHDDPFLPAGKLGYSSGPMLAGVDMLTISVYGEGGHGAYPHNTIDPVVLSAQMILAFQTVVSRNVKPIYPAVVTVGAIQGGTVANIIPDQVNMAITVRQYDMEVRNYILQRIEEISYNLARAAGLSEDKMPTIEIREPNTPPLLNDPVLTTRMVEVFNTNFGADNVVERTPEMGGEDFSQFGNQSKKIPICMFRLGAGDADKLAKALQNGEEIPGLHSPYFAPVYEPTIRTGVKAMTVFAMDILKK